MSIYTLLCTHYYVHIIMYIKIFVRFRESIDQNLARHIPIQ